MNFAGLVFWFDRLKLPISLLPLGPDHSGFMFYNLFVV